ncbi:NAD(P)H-dependent oxidoreductase [Marinobacterium sp. D7]|uniref:NADPH-dependent FMN reductase n=1 Tax=Marinobacterium ramblicola TaxID=2849041 RepID=UPI001C2DCBD3|nr:NAD(P)H-dependent oxidoreductase [Marinobacterium ramblicola]MBV1789055.1 NAD(P)H-dependent oxidoreductase [Marinobacterium ramblicola]
MKLLALSGSLRKVSYNTAALEALSALAPDDIEVVIGDISQLPLFNPDLEEAPIAVLESLKSALAEASGLIIASPEYAHGISGPMKNALDWLVSGEEFPYKPIMLINTSPRASHAQEALKEVLTTMSGILVDSAYVSLPLLSSGLDRDGILADTALCKSLTTGLDNFRNEIEVLSRNVLTD